MSSSPYPPKWISISCHRSQLQIRALDIKRWVAEWISFLKATLDVFRSAMIHSNLDLKEETQKM